MGSPLVSVRGHIEALAAVRARCTMVGAVLCLWGVTCELINEDGRLGKPVAIAVSILLPEIGAEHG